MGDASASGDSRYGGAFDITNENAGPPLVNNSNEFDDRVNEALEHLREQIGKKAENLRKLFSRQES